MSKLRRQLSANTPSVVETKSLIDIKAKTGNLYESIAIVARKANQCIYQRRIAQQIGRVC